MANFTSSAALIALFCCVAASGVDSQYVFHSTIDVLPSSTGSGITDGLLGPGFGRHSAYWKPSVASCATTGGCGLFVMLSGSTGQPRFTRYMQNTAAGQGFHVVGLAYNNADSLQNLCAGQATQTASQSCQYNSRREVITGEPLSTFIAVTVADSIENRLVKLLQHLHGLNSTLGWDRYFTAPDTLHWNKMTFAGHSQGAGTAQILSMLHPVHRVIKYAGGVFLTPGNYPGIFAFTNSSAYYTFTHTGDSLFAGIQSLDDTTLDLDTFGPVVNRDTATPPYSNTHKLSSSIANVSDAHGCVAGDREIQFDGQGAPVYELTWRYLMGTPSHDVAPTTVGSSAVTTTSSSSTAAAASTSTGSPGSESSETSAALPVSRPSGLFAVAIGVVFASQFSW